MKDDDDETVREEEGGMRFTFDNMPNLMALLLYMSLEEQIVPFPMNSGGNNRLYFRGKRFTQADAHKNNYEIWEKLYHLEEQEKRINPKEIINVIFNRILDANPNFQNRSENRDPEFWQAFRLECKWSEIPLNEWNLWNLCSEMGYSQECITLLYRSLGFNGTFLSNMNSGSAYQLLADFPVDPDFKTLERGFL